MDRNEEVIKFDRAMTLIIFTVITVLIVVFTSPNTDDTSSSSIPTYIIDTIEVIEEDGVRWYTLDTLVYE